MTTSEMVMVSAAGPAHPRVWGDIGTTDIYANTTVAPIFGMSTSLVGWAGTVAHNIQAIAPYVRISDGAHGVVVLYAGAASDTFLPFINGVQLAPLP